ncbi:MAG: 4-(cytidine 5'-diphospho)-2-C-methyl-D-erythritol kinase [Bifidobacteriaceae bacterium]|jgi:4-diphosphocytidyl-2-C-methyl-D-erythritol kinase|nr:4-(cytidine 5'-diphospho)-2-C-methyl-D-erythritol kinase [Bifidobacteriaceae bacterium]
MAVAPAKLNLHLGVGERGADGYHPLCTVFHAVDLWERVTVHRSDAPGVRIEVRGVGAPGVPRDGTNLAARAAVAVARHVGADIAVDVEIDKAIPVAGGLAGGSADAAAALLACDALWEADLEPAELMNIAAGLGADVPFALAGGTALGRGRGEILEPIAVGAEMWWVLITSDQGLATPEIFAAWDRAHEPSGTPGPAKAGLRPPQELITALARGDLAEVGRHLVNDLQPCSMAAAPELGTRLNAALAAGALGAVVSGSGPTIAVLGASRDAATSIAAGLRLALTTCDVTVARALPGGARLIHAS